MISDKNKRLALLLPAGILIIMIIYTKAVIPFMHKYTRQSQQIEQNNILLEKNKIIIDEKEHLNQGFADLSQKLQARLPLERGESKFLAAIGDVAQATNVHIENMNPRPLRDLDFFKELSVEIDMEANLGNLVRFLYQMRKSSVVLVANRLRLEPKSERSALLKGHLVISTIFLKESG